MARRSETSVFNGDILRRVACPRHYCPLRPPATAENRRTIFCLRPSPTLATFFSERVPAFRPAVNRVWPTGRMSVWRVLRADRGGTIAPMPGQSDNIGVPSLVQGRYPLLSADGGYRRKTTRCLRIPHGIGVTGAWHSQHVVGVRTYVPKSAHCGAGVGSLAVNGEEDVTADPLYSSSVR